jgi:DNA-binding transcriptional regulator YdaS (Cro superfamily)
MLNIRPMKTTDAVRHFGTATKLARALGISKAAVSQWGASVPELRKLQLEKLMAGAASDEEPRGQRPSAAGA